MKNFLLICLMVLFTTPASAKIEKIKNKNPIETAQTLGNISDIPPAKVAKIQQHSTKFIEDMIRNMSDEDLKKYVKAINNAEIRAAKQSGRKVPPLLDEATLNNRDKIREYLRSAYKYTY